jgi:hypothetical protein
MSFGDCPDDAALRAAWKRFCRSLEEAGDQPFKDLNPSNPLQRADAFRFLTQNLSQAFDFSLETRSTRYPVIHAFCTPFRKLGGDNADFLYQQAWIDGGSIYRISGNRGTCRFLNFAVQGERPTRRADNPDWRPLHEPFGDTPRANLFGHQMELGWDGSFELYIGGEQRGPNWLPTTPDTRKLFIRQGFDDWSERPATMRIERVDMAEPRPIPDPAEMIEAFDWAGDFLRDMMADWPEWPFAFGEGVDAEELNRFPDDPRDTADPVYNRETDRKRGRAPQNMCWKLAADEALIVEWEKNDIFWMMTNMGMFFNSMDYLYRPVSYSPARTTVDSDGRIRLILAHRDPGFHNWIDTQGFERGALCNRNMLTGVETQFSTRVVPFDSLDKLLENISARTAPEERSAQLRARFHAIMMRMSA